MKQNSSATYLFDVNATSSDPSVLAMLFPSSPKHMILLLKIAADPCKRKTPLFAK